MYEPHGDIAKRYSKLQGEREPYVTRARACASVTIPSLFPPDTTSGSADLRTPRQSIGAKCVNTLAAKLLLAELPPNQPFFKLTVDEEHVLDLPENSREGVIKGLVSTESHILTTIESRGARPVVHEMLKQLIVAGNALLHVSKDAFKVYRLDKYVVQRDAMGSLTEVIICEGLSPENVPAHMREALAETTTEQRKHLKLYTQVRLHGNHWVLNQEINGALDPKARSTYPKDRLPFLALRMIRVDGEEYGRSYVEEYLGDLKSAEALSKAIDEGTAAAAKVIFLVNPNGTTRSRALSKAPNGGFVAGNEADVHVLQLQKHADFAQARQRLAEIREDLSAAFLTNSSLTRQAERVTATEIRAMAQELETVLGGVYSLLSIEFQAPLVEIVIAQLTREGALPNLPPKTLKPKVLTGVAALGRTQELEKLKMLLEFLQPLGEDAINEYLEGSGYVARVVAALSIDPEGLLPSPEKMRERQSQKRMDQMAQNAPAMLQASGAFS